MRAATVEGRPKTPLPMIELTTSATRLQRPIARSSSRRGGFADGDSIRAFVSHTRVVRTAAVTGAPLFAPARPLRVRSQGRQPRRLSPNGPLRPEVTLPFNSKVTSLQRENPCQ